MAQRGTVGTRRLRPKPCLPRPLPPFSPPLGPQGSTWPRAGAPRMFVERMNEESVNQSGQNRNRSTSRSFKIRRSEQGSGLPLTTISAQFQGSWVLGCWTCALNLKVLVAQLCPAACQTPLSMEFSR